MLELHLQLHCHRLNDFQQLKCSFSFGCIEVMATAEERENIACLHQNFGDAIIAKISVVAKPDKLCSVS